MARIRTIKPPFWTDPGIMQISLPARLMFIGTWTFADDNGNLEAHPKMLKALIFPGDEIKVEPILAELIEHNFLIPYSVNGKNYLHIRTFKKHQKINRPSPAICPLYEDSVSHHGGLSEPSRQEGISSRIGSCSGKKSIGMGRETEGKRKGDAGEGETSGVSASEKHATSTTKEEERRRELQAQAERLKLEGRF